MICRLCQYQRVNVSGPGEYSKYENRMICRARNEECDVPHCSWLNCDHFYNVDDMPHKKYEHTYEVFHGWGLKQFMSVNAGDVVGGFLKIVIIVLLVGMNIRSGMKIGI